MDTTFGSNLKEWRNRRRLSQMDLGLSANVSARHISFLETGRSRPSQPMVRQLCETLAMPRAARNGMLNAAGFAKVYGSRTLDEADMAPVRAAVDWTLQRHDPYPAMALDRHWNIVKANKTGQMLLEAAGLEEGHGLLDVMTDRQRVIDLFENWQEVLVHMIARLGTESTHLGGDAKLDQTISHLRSILGDELPYSNGILPPVIPARYRANGMVFSFFSTIAQFGSAEDIALADLKIELMFPADEKTKSVLMAMQA